MRDTAMIDLLVRHYLGQVQPSLWILRYKHCWTKIIQPISVFAEHAILIQALYQLRRMCSVYIYDGVQNLKQKFHGRY